jgi:ankyrin repeat protein
MNWKRIHGACWAGDPLEVEHLLVEGADPNQVAPTTWRQTPLGRTLEFRMTHPKHVGHVEVVRLLLAHGADPVARSTPLDMTPYELACFCGLGEAAELLRPFQKRAAAHPTGMTPVWLAAASRVLVRLPRGDRNCVWRGATPLMMAAAHAGNWRVADRLLREGADPNAGTSLLHASCQWHFEHLLPALEYFARNGWDVNGRDADGHTALHKAKFLRYRRAERTLLALGAEGAPLVP